MPAPILPFRRWLAGFEQMRRGRRTAGTPAYSDRMTTYCLPATVHVARDADGAVLLDRDRGLVYALNPVASEILAAIGEGLDDERLEDRLRQTFAGIEGDLHADITGFIDRLLTAGLLVKSTGPALPRADALPGAP